MSQYALNSALVQNLAREHWGAKVQDSEGNWIDTGVQDVVDAIVNGLSNQAPIKLNGPLEFIAPAQGGPTIIIHRNVPVIGDNSEGDSFNLNVNPSVIRFIDQNQNFVDVPGGNSNVTNVAIGGNSSGGGGVFTGTIQLLSDVSVTSVGNVSVSGCTATLSVTNTVTKTYINLIVKDGDIVGVS